MDGLLLRSEVLNLYMIIMIYINSVIQYICIYIYIYIYIYMLYKKYTNIIIYLKYKER